MQGPSTFDSRTKARSLAFLFAAGALVGILTIDFPHERTIQAGPVLAVSAVSLALALACLWIDTRLSEPLLHGGLALVTVILTLLVHFTEQSTLYPLIYMWPALYAFYFFSTTAALAHLALIGVAYGTVLSIDDTMEATIRLLLVLGTPLVVGLLISRLLATMREGMQRSARQERALRSSERRTRLIVDSARDGFISTDAQGACSTSTRPPSRCSDARARRCSGVRFRSSAFRRRSTRGSTSADGHCSRARARTAPGTSLCTCRSTAPTEPGCSRRR